MSDISWEDNLWTDTTREAYLQAGEAAILALRAHLSTVAASTSDADEDAIDESAETVRQAFIAVSDAQFEYSSTVAPFSLLDDEDDADADEDDDSVEDAGGHDKLSILLRRDFRLTSEAALIKAGRTAARAAGSQDPTDPAAEDVSELARAMYQIVHAGGVDALNDVDGIEPVVGVMLALGRDDILTEAEVDAMLEEDPGELFAGEGEVIYSQSEVWS